jgi:hypothetical protein
MSLFRILIGQIPINNITKLLHTLYRRIIKPFVILGVFSAITYISFIVGILEGKRVYGTSSKFYTDLPNSCFIEALIHSSRASLVLKSDVEAYSSIYGFTYYLGDSKNNKQIFGHAVSIFEYKNKLWIYDPVWGTMLVGKATARSQYEKMCTEFIEKCYRYKIQRSFVVDDWSVPSSFTD